MATHNGHRNWTHWNVSLWINNDEMLYRHARDLAAEFGRDLAARHFIQWLANMGETKTPDGARYSVTSIKAAMRDIV